MAGLCSGLSYCPLARARVFPAATYFDIILHSLKKDILMRARFIERKIFTVRKGAETL